MKGKAATTDKKPRTCTRKKIDPRWYDFEQIERQRAWLANVERLARALRTLKGFDVDMDLIASILAQVEIKKHGDESMQFAMNRLVLAVADRAEQLITQTYQALN